MGRFPDGADTDSNCADFLVQPATTFAAASGSGATNVKIGSAAGFAAGQTIQIDTGANAEIATIAVVGTAGATTARGATDRRATVIPVAGIFGFAAGETVTIDAGGSQETAIVAAVAGGRGGATMTVAAPLTSAHAAGAPISGSGLTLTAALTKAHAAGVPIAGGAPTPGARNNPPGR